MTCGTSKHSMSVDLTVLSNHLTLDFCNMTCGTSKHSMSVDLTVLSNYLTLDLWPALRCFVRRWIGAADSIFRAHVLQKCQSRRRKFKPLSMLLKKK
jgi:hypothetical protein